jgi:hypothetical protein
MPEYRKAEVKKPRGLWPLYGLVMMIAAAGIGWALAPELYRLLNRNSGFSIGTFTPDQVKLFLAGIIFFIVVAIGGLIIALFMPKRKEDTVQDAFLKKQKQAMVKEEKARRVRRSIIEHELKKSNKRIE